MSRHAENKRCPGCGTEFQCLAHCGGNTCWCMELPRVPMPTGADAACLCPACLRVLIQKQLERAASSPE